VKALRRCYDLLQKAERRIELLSGMHAEGNPVTQPFDDRSSASLEEKREGRSRRRTAGREADLPEKPPADGGYSDIDGRGEPV